MDVFEKFVGDFEERLNQLRLVELGVIVSKEIDSKRISLSHLTAEPNIHHC